MKREDALFWLNDRCGSHVSAVIKVELDGGAGSLLSVEGVLEHWNKDGGDELETLGGSELETLAGLYTVGADGALDLTELPPDTEIRVRGEELVVGLAEETWLSVVRAQ